MRADPALHTERFEEVILPSGLQLPVVDQAYRLDGTPEPGGGNVLLLFHSLTGGPNPADWWPDLIRPGGVLDRARWALLTPNLLGSCYGTVAGDRGGEERTPGADLLGASITLRDMVHLVGLLLDRLGIPRVRLATGGSLGGMAALEWASSFPERAQGIVAFAAPAAHTAQAIGFSRIQRHLLRLGGPVEGLELAREAAMLTYRTHRELEERFGRERREDGTFQVESWLEGHGHRLRERFHPESYRILMDAMDTHDIGDGRGGVAAALAPFTGRLTGVGIPGDLLYTPEDVRRWTDAARGEYREIHSVCGHDAFLIEADQAGAILAEALEAE